MPSLRRSFSSPSVRSSPYPSSLSSSAIRSRLSPFHPRRSSPSATAERRVLADIEWWRVYDGQCNPDHAHRVAHELDADISPGGTLTLSASGGSLRTHSFSVGAMEYVYPNALAGLSISPLASRHGEDTSVESTPELSTTPLETFQLDQASQVSCPFNDLFGFPSSLGSRHVHPLFGLRSISVPGLSHQMTLAPDFADMGGDSFSLDQNLFQ